MYALHVKSNEQQFSEYKNMSADGNCHAVKIICKLWWQKTSTVKEDWIFSFTRAPKRQPYLT
jgi:hypothetical protein